MKVYFDYSNVEEFIKQKDELLYPDCIRALQRQLDTQFNFSKDDLLSNEIMLSWFRRFSSGVGSSTQHFSEQKFPERPLKSNAHISMNNQQLGSIYLLDDEKINKFIAAAAVLVGSPGQETQTISRLFLHNHDYEFEKKLKIGGTELKKWSDIEKYTFQNSDILIIDPYILCDGPSTKFNLFPLLKLLTHQSRCKVNVVIYTEFRDEHLSYADITQYARRSITEVTGKRINLTVVKYRNAPKIKVDEAEHDRTIVTNYVRYYSGDTFNYWSEDGSKKTNGRELLIAGYGKRANHDLALELINEIQAHLDSSTNIIIEGDKKSNFLTFK